MNEDWSASGPALALAAGAVCVLLDLVLSIAVVAADSSSRVALRRLRADAPARYAFLERLREPHSTYRLAAIILRQLSIIGAVTGFTIAARLDGWKLPELVGGGAAAVLGVLIAESLVARSVAAGYARPALRASGALLRTARALLVPVVVPLGRLVARIDSAQQLSDGEREEEQDQEVEALIEAGERSGILEAAEGEMMRGIVDLDETRVREIMTPRTDIVAVPAQTRVAEARRRFLDAGHSRMPVYSDSIDNVIGVLHSRDLFQAWDREEEDKDVSHYLRPAVFVPETLSAADLLSEMRQRTQIAVVVDEYGGVAGLVTLEDVLEEIVGDIRDEHDEEEQLFHEESEGNWIVDAVTHVDELESLFGVEFGERDFDTVGGLVIWRFGRVPAAGETLETHGLHLQVLASDDRRVQRVRVRRADPAEGAASGA